MLNYHSLRRSLQEYRRSVIKSVSTDGKFVEIAKCYVSHWEQKEAENVVLKSFTF
jgi:hypothetical protein